MFVYNVKVNGSKIFKIFFTAIVLLIICILCIVIFRVFSGANNSSSSNSSYISKDNVCKISSNNYTNVLKAVHDDISSYVGVRINFSGYIYRLIDFKENQFVLARNMVISSDFQTVVVGFLCEADNAKDFADDTWVQIEGTITKGNYNGEIPIIEVDSIHQVEVPTDEYVYPPDSSFVTTSTVL